MIEVTENKTRNTIVWAIESLLEHPNQKEDVNQVLALLRHKLSEEKNLFSFDSIVFGPFLSQVLSSEVQLEPETMIILKDELIGKTPYWNTYALKYDFTKLLYGDTLEAYQRLKEFLNLLVSYLNTNGVLEDIVERYEDLLEVLYEFCYGKLQSNTIAELLLGQSCHILLSLPHPILSYFDVQDVFSSIYPISDMEKTNNQLGHVQGLLQKLEGKIVLFVDVHLLTDGFILNLR